MEVRLTAQEVALAAYAGLMRTLQSMKKYDDKFGADKGLNGWQLDIEGALGEYALCKTLKIFWSGITNIKASDAQNWQVRTTPRHDGRLIIRPNDSDDLPFVLVTGSMGRYVIRGWINGDDAKQTQWWTDAGNGRPGAWFVPQDALTQFSAELKEAA